MKRGDSIRSRRKVSTLSDRSDFSDHMEPDPVSGEESPGILSDEQNFDSPSDDDTTARGHLPWIKTVVQMANSYNFICTHQGYCHPRCYRRQMRACNRLCHAVRTVSILNVTVVQLGKFKIVG